MKRLSVLVGAGVTVGLFALLPSVAFAHGPGHFVPWRGEPSSFLQHLNTVSQVASTVPGNGDVSPVGTAIVPVTSGNLTRGHVLVTNFDNSTSEPGTGSTIVDIAPDGTVTPFAQIDASSLPGSCPGGVGLTGALVVLRSGFVIAGSLPTSDGTAATAQAGCLLILDNTGQVVETISGNNIDGPWGLTAFDAGRFVTLFVSNVLNGTVAGGGSTVDNGTVVRIGLAIAGFGAAAPQPKVLGSTVIASGFGEKTDTTGLVSGPTGLALGAFGTLYVADNVGNRVAAISNAFFRRRSDDTGHTVTTGGSLNGPLGLALTPGGDILSSNSGDGNLVETTVWGRQVGTTTLDSTGTPPGAGTLFGIAVTRDPGVYFVDDATNSLNLLSFTPPTPSPSPSASPSPSPKPKPAPSAKPTPSPRSTPSAQPSPSASPTTGTNPWSGSTLGSGHSGTGSDPSRGGSVPTHTTGGHF